MQFESLRFSGTKSSKKTYKTMFISCEIFNLSCLWGMCRQNSCHPMTAALLSWKKLFIFEQGIGNYIDIVQNLGGKIGIADPKLFLRDRYGCDH